jgi:hypothetical protein
VLVTGTRGPVDEKICGVLDVASGLAFEARYSLWDSCLYGSLHPDAGQTPRIGAMIIGFLVAHAAD